MTSGQKNSDKEEQLLFMLSIKVPYKTSIIKTVWWSGVNTEWQNEKNRDSYIVQNAS